MGWWESLGPKSLKEGIWAIRVSKESIETALIRAWVRESIDSAWVEATSDFPFLLGGSSLEL